MANTKAKKAEQGSNAPVSAAKKNSLWYNTKKNMPFVIFALPAFLVLFFIMYVPMGGIIMAFQDFKPMQGFFGSRFVGLENFKFLFTSKDVFYRMTRNTIMYYFIFTLLGTFLNIVLAIALDQFVFKKVGRAMQTIMIVPIFTVLEKIDPKVIEASYDLGSNKVNSFLRVTLPLSLGGIVSGIIMTFLPSLTQFEVSDAISYNNVVLLGNLIYTRFKGTGGFNVGSVFSLFTVLFTIIGFVLLLRVDKEGETLI